MYYIPDYMYILLLRYTYILLCNNNICIYIYTPYNIIILYILLYITIMLSLFVVLKAVLAMERSDNLVALKVPARENMDKSLRSRYLTPK